jgi:hypothetical protein
VKAAKKRAQKSCEEFGQIRSFSGLSYFQYMSFRENRSATHVTFFGSRKLGVSSMLYRNKANLIEG